MDEFCSAVSEAIAVCDCVCDCVCVSFLDSAWFETVHLAPPVNSLVPSSLLIFDLLTSAVSLPMASASLGLALRIRIRRGLGGGGGGGRGFTAAATDDGRGGRGRRRDASPVIVLFPCLLLERERKRESCPSGKRAEVACVRPRTLPPLPLRSEKQSEREEELVFGRARFFRLCVFCLEFFPLLVNSRLDLFLVLFSPPRGPLSFLFHFSPCLSLRHHQTSQPWPWLPQRGAFSAAGEPRRGSPSGSPPRQQQRQQQELCPRFHRRRRRPLHPSRSISNPAAPRATPRTPTLLSARYDKRAFFASETIEEKEENHRRGERERERERKEGKKKRPCT